MILFWILIVLNLIEMFIRVDFLKFDIIINSTVHSVTISGIPLVCILLLIGSYIKFKLTGR